jgi:hypothetical protein
MEKKKDESRAACILRSDAVLSGCAASVDRFCGMKLLKRRSTAFFVDKE